MTISLANQNTSPSIRIPNSRIKNDNALSWIYENLESHKLSHKLKYLISDTEHLNTCYEVTAFLQNEKYVGAFFLCLRSLENNQPNLLTQIDCTLCCAKVTAKTHHQHKRSTSHPHFSVLVPLPAVSTPTPIMGNRTSRYDDYDSADGASSSTSLYHIHIEAPIKKLKKKSRHKERKSKEPKTKIVNLKLRQWSSNPDLLHTNATTHRARSKTISQPIRIPYKKVKLTTEVLAKINENNQQVPSSSITTPTPTTIKPLSNNSASSSQPIASGSGSCPSPDLVPISLIRCDDIKIHVDRRQMVKPIVAELVAGRSNDSNESSPPTPKQTSLLSCFPSKIGLNFKLLNSEKAESNSMYSNFGPGSAPGDFVSEFMPKEGEKIQNRYSRPIMDDIGGDGGGIDNYTPPIFGRQPMQGQSLTSFLESAQFSRVNSDLERENAHFSVSEAMISAIEQIKWERQQKIRQKKYESKKNKRRRMRDWVTNEKTRSKSSIIVLLEIC